MSLALLSESQGAKRQRCGELEYSTTRGFDLFSASSTPVQSGRSSPVHVHIPMPNQMITVGYFGSAIPDGGEVTTEQWEAFVRTYVAQRLGPPSTPQTRRRRTACWCKLQTSKLTQMFLVTGPGSFTLSEAIGYWKGCRERTFVLTGTARGRSRTGCLVWAGCGVFLRPRAHP
jgi:hypothetical protein